MTQVYTYLRKVVALTINFLVYLLVSKYSIIPAFISIPVLTLSFSIIASKILGESPKELFNTQRSEIYFSKGGLRDLLRIPVVLFAFIHNVFVWAIWGVYQVFVLITDTTLFIKELVFQLLYALIWFFKLLIPFWRIAARIKLYYFIKWPWWMYQYAFNTIKKTYNWNILKVSFIGSFFAVLVFCFFYFIEIAVEGNNPMYIGIIVALLPLTWAFGEISSIRGQDLMFVEFLEVRQQFRNGLESVRGILFFIAIFVVLVLLEAALIATGLIPNSGILILGFTININFIINIILCFLAVLILFGSFTLPTYRLYNKFSESSIKDVYNLFKYIVRRSLQYCFGLIPSSFFAGISAIPALALLAFSLFITLELKNNIIDIKIDKLNKQHTSTSAQIEDYILLKKINQLQYTKAFPTQFNQEIEHRRLVKEELLDYEYKSRDLKLYINKYTLETERKQSELQKLIALENQKPVINQTRIEGYEKTIHNLNRMLKNEIKINDIETNKTLIDIEYAERKYGQLPWLILLSGLFIVLTSSLVFTFIVAYFGNFFYKSYMFKNDDTPAIWKDYLSDEHNIDRKQPLLSTTINLVLLGLIIFICVRYLSLESIKDFINEL